jgi:hypothetical protein
VSAGLTAVRVVAEVEVGEFRAHEAGSAAQKSGNKLSVALQLSNGNVF